MKGYPMSEKEGDFNKKPIEERLAAARGEKARSGSKKQKKPVRYFMVPKDATHSGHMDTQLFPDRKPPYHE